MLRSLYGPKYNPHYEGYLTFAAARLDHAKMLRSDLNQDETNAVFEISVKYLNFGKIKLNKF